MIIDSFTISGLIVTLIVSFVLGYLVVRDQPSNHKG